MTTKIFSLIILFSHFLCLKGFSSCSEKTIQAWLDSPPARRETAGRSAKKILGPAIKTFDKSTELLDMGASGMRSGSDLAAVSGSTTIAAGLTVGTAGVLQL